MLLLTTVSALQLPRRQFLGSVALVDNSVYTRGCSRLPRDIVINVEDPQATLEFFEKGLDMVVDKDRVSWGPTQLSRPPGFRPGVSSFDEDGGHASIVVGRGPGNPGDGVAFVQMAMSFVRASKLVTYGGTITEAYGNVNVIAPGGLPLRLLVGDEVKDRMMYVALKYQDVPRARKFYEDLGYREAPYPRARLPTKEETPFDPNPPRGSVYLQYCDDSLGLLLTRSYKDRFTANYAKPVVGDVYAGLRIAAPPTDPVFTDGQPLQLRDPEGYPCTLMPTLT